MGGNPIIREIHLMGNFDKQSFGFIHHAQNTDVPQKSHPTQQ
jgi:hypothetical protein